MSTQEWMKRIAITTISGVMVSAIAITTGVLYEKVSSGALVAIIGGVKLTDFNKLEKDFEERIPKPHSHNISDLGGVANTDFEDLENRIQKPHSHNISDLGGVANTDFEDLENRIQKPHGHNISDLGGIANTDSRLHIHKPQVLHPVFPIPTPSPMFRQEPLFAMPPSPDRDGSLF